MSDRAVLGLPGAAEAKAKAPILALAGVARRFQQGQTALEVLRGVDLQIRPGEMVALVGPSGAGKSTLLQIAGLLEAPDAGTVTIAGTEATGLPDGKRTALRRRDIGFVYQFHHLLPEFSALENLVIPQMLNGIKRREARVRAAELLHLVGLTDRAEHRPARLSGGEQQRVAIARALANAPRLVLADEPTGNLDHATGDRVFDLLHRLVYATEVGALVATHNLDLADRMDRVVEVRDGALIAHDR